MYIALYRKYRPQKLEDVVGQEVVVKTLTNQIKNNRISHAYLFCGPRGTGKTSIAKIVSKIVNCENLNDIDPCNKCVNCTQINNKQTTDVIEIDAASNNGVDEIRELRNKAALIPSFGKYKVYIIDEVHMLTTQAFNALLKTLEEPPKHVIFILATTEPQKIPQTILSRCQRFDFKKISQNKIVERLKNICELENIKFKSGTLEMISKISDGGMRDSVGLLDQLNAYCDDAISIEDVNEVCGILIENEVFNFSKLLFQNKIKELYEKLDFYDSSGKNLSKIFEQVIEFLKNVLIYLNCENYPFTEEQKSFYGEICDFINEDKIYSTINQFMESLKIVKTSNNPKLLFELLIINIISQNENIKKDIKEGNISLEPQRINNIKKEINVDVKEVSKEFKEQIEKIKTIRINNTLAQFDKKQFIEFKEKLDDIKILLMDPNYSSIVSLILDGNLKAKGNEYLIFVYVNENLEQYFNFNILKIEEIFFKVFGEKYKVISTNSSDWEIIKSKFNKSISSETNLYKKVEEDFDLKKILNVENKKENEVSNDKNTNSIEIEFENIIDYK